MVVINASTFASGLRPLAAIPMGRNVHFLFLFWKINDLFGHNRKCHLTWIKRKRGTLMLLDTRIRLVAKSYGEANHKTLKRAVNFWRVVEQSLWPFRTFHRISQSMALWGFPRDTQEGPVYVFIIQCVLVYVLFVVWTVHFHASLPALEMLLGFLLGEVKMSNSFCSPAQ